MGNSQAMSNYFFWSFLIRLFFSSWGLKRHHWRIPILGGRGFACYRCFLFFQFTVSTLKFWGGYFPQAHNITSFLYFLQYPSKIFLMVHSIVLKNDITTNQEIPGSSDYRGMSLGWMYFRHLSLEHMTQGFWRNMYLVQFLRHIM